MSLVEGSTWCLASRDAERNVSRRPVGNPRQRVILRHEHCPDVIRVNRRRTRQIRQPALSRFRNALHPPRVLQSSWRQVGQRRPAVYLSRREVRRRGRQVC